MSVLQVLFYFFIAIAIIQYIYYICFLNFFSSIKSKKEKQKNIPVSVIICSKNEAENLAPIEQQLEVLKDQIKHYKTRIDSLTVRAPHRGTWVAPQVDEFQGMWSDRGNPIGYVVNNDSYYFSSILSQDDASRLFNEEIPDARVRLVGESEHKIPVHDQRVIQGEQSQLPSAALGFYGGGDIAVSSEDAKNTVELAKFLYCHKNNFLRRRHLLPRHRI